MTTLGFQQVLTTARRLPKSSQIKLASALLKEAAPTPAAPLQPLIGLSVDELGALAESVLAPRRARRLKQLLRLNRERKLTRAMRIELDALLEESDRVALVKAKALYTLRSSA